ncbi:hypothetical protein P5705_12675 [Pseudomonas entomophila]|uniref:hypothetical protein n=1 Tax=Pseudomonas entomophila TaxID=312306 RepID=UPI0024064BD8|nr:hypothetical protein [Pseudomonas entomophila]MDF9618504.1 hypothetical protein [Pseudomonas entomophila]
MNHDELLAGANITEDEFKRSGCTFENLVAIYEHYQKIQSPLNSAAKMIASTIQTFEKVHSVRWRVKDPFHLIKKIVRKNLEENPQEKWTTVSPDNYLWVVTDLIGVRALHLFKDECAPIDESIRDYWELAEDVIAYVRAGEEPHDAISARGAVKKDHDGGYRSIHYIVKIQPAKLTFYAELQVRTIFQEGWSEVDHTVRYPDFSDNAQIAIFLRLFSGLAGSADEMGLFAKDLNELLKGAEAEKLQLMTDHQRIAAELEDATRNVDATLARLESLETKDEQSQKIIRQLKKDINKLKSTEDRAGASQYGISKHGLERGIMYSGKSISHFLDLMKERRD